LIESSHRKLGERKKKSLSSFHFSWVIWGRSGRDGLTTTPWQQQQKQRLRKKEGRKASGNNQQEIAHLHRDLLL
jgi:hypothetical protein